MSSGAPLLPLVEIEQRGAK